ncbi:hypothetical protein [Pandoraea aquatica]|nr:hypothetical protein [Pandoraea aquatica]
MSFAASVALGVFAAAIWKFPPTNSGEWASWMQAVGAIAGIALALYLPWSQREHAAREQRAKEQRNRIGLLNRSLRTIDGFVRFCENLMEKSGFTPELYNVPQSFDFESNQIREFVEIANGIEGDDDSDETVGVPGGIRDVATRLLSAIEAYKKMRIHSGNKSMIRYAINDCMQELIALRADVLRSLEQIELLSSQQR